MEGAGKKFEAPSGNSTSTEILEMTVEDRAEQIATVQEQIAALRDRLNEYVGKNLTGALLVEADAIAKSLMEAEIALEKHIAAAGKRRWDMPDESPFGLAREVPSSAQQVLSPTAKDGFPANGKLPELVAEAT